ncbi:ChaN family lipoprotein [Longimicrobium terrae]|uniref:Putative iron-regulated protein n=1 Tax=Longimicrobium terrae TaxID=1639882 RepID=A0A841H196_9BACT|nr:ChaN family lipoprotein [Longimicrobium terrae]MBB4637346.1 putative iron-regulated protein [Longimicrobium terrae]MBB6071744.1 putative iron-regulated protein [Longimicrobium terrae]NNC28505.1 ChaN family lipoprotein [Longimicrobium terrae]
MRVPLTALLAILCLAHAIPANAQADSAFVALDTRTGQTVSLDRMADSLARFDVVFLGEQHDDPVTHQVQAGLLRLIGQRRREVILALEMFERDVQTQVDEYAAGRISEADFLAQSRPWPNYATDYRPLVEIARANRWPVAAGNVPRPIAASVSRSGMQAAMAMDPAQWRLFAADRRCAPEGEYFRRFGEAMGGMGGHGAAVEGGESPLVRFYAAQCLKDETMAESIERARQSWPGWMVVHVNGGFHSERRLGTVERTARRLPSARIATVLMVPVADPARADHADAAALADYVVYTRAAAPAARQP